MRDAKRPHSCQLALVPNRNLRRRHLLVAHDALDVIEQLVQFVLVDGSHVTLRPFWRAPSLELVQAPPITPPSHLFRCPALDAGPRPRSSPAGHRPASHLPPARDLSDHLALDILNPSPHHKNIRPCEAKETRPWQPSPSWRPRTEPNRPEQQVPSRTFQNRPTSTTQTPRSPAKTRHILHRTAGEKFLFNHQPAAETAPGPNTDPPTNAAPRQRTRTNATEQARTPRTIENLPTPTKLNHPDRTISCKTRRFPLRAVGEKFLPNHQPGAETHAHANNVRPDNSSEPVRSSRVV